MANPKKPATPTMDATAFRRALKAGTVSGGYLFIGEEQYLKRYCLAELRKNLLPDPTFAMFNHTKLSFAEADKDAFLSALEAPPMMAERKLVELHEIPFGALPAEELDNLLTELALLPSYPDTVLVLYAMPEEWDTTPKNKKFETLLARFAEVVTPVVFARETPAKLCKWIRGHFTAQGIAIGDDHCERLRLLCGDSMDALSAEIEKLSAYLLAKGSDIVTDADITEVVSSTREAGGFDFVNAILAGGCGKAYLYFQNYKAARVPPEMLLGQIVRVYQSLSQIKICADAGMTADTIATQIGMNPWQLSKYLPVARATPTEVLVSAVTACAAADAALKLRTSDGYMTLEFLIAELAQARRKART